MTLDLERLLGLELTAWEAASIIRQYRLKGMVIGAVASRVVSKKPDALKLWLRAVPR